MDIARITEPTVQRALDDVRTHRPFGDSPLLATALVERRVRDEGMGSSDVAREWALKAILSEVVSRTIDTHRAAHGAANVGVAGRQGAPPRGSAAPLGSQAPVGRPSPALAAILPAAERARLESDFVGDDPEREAWSCLYYRYIHAPPVQAREIAAIVRRGSPHGTKHISRRTRRGLYLLVAVLRSLEHAENLAEREAARTRHGPVPAAAEVGSDATVSPVDTTHVAPPPADPTAIVRDASAGEVSTLAAGTPVAPKPVPPGNLPLRHTSFLGRAAALAGITERLAHASIVTLTGPGGVGKTRLAMEYARLHAGDHPDGVWYVDLDILPGADRLAHAVAAVLGAHTVDTAATPDEIVRHIGSGRMLLVLDNCEHVIDAVADLVGVLVAACPNLKAIVTSREVLRIEGESVWGVRPLATPPPDRAIRMAEVPEYPGVQLFVERARAVQRGFSATDDATIAVVARLCAALDGLPLAIELAAAQTRTMSVDEIVARLDDRSHLQNAGRRGGRTCHQTLWSVIDWSYCLLAEDERRLLRRLTVFRGGWTLDAACAVCADDALPGPALVPLLARLGDKSLVQTGVTGRESRQQMLDCVRVYVEAQRDATDLAELPSLRDRHLAWHVALSARADDGLRVGTRDTWLPRLDVERDNLIAALMWARHRGDLAATATLAEALRSYWAVRQVAGDARTGVREVLDSVGADLAEE